MPHYLTTEGSQTPPVGIPYFPSMADACLAFQRIDEAAKDWRSSQQSQDVIENELRSHYSNENVQRWIVNQFRRRIANQERD